MTYSAEDFPPGTPERYEVIMHSAGALCNPDDVVEDYGDYNEDVLPDQEALSWEHTDVDAPVEIEFTAVNNFNRLYYDT